MADKRKKYDDDDGRTIADMSSIDRQLPLGMGFVKEQHRKQDETQSSSEGHEWESSFTREERRAHVFAALGAALLIGAVFLLGIGGVIAAIAFFWGA